MAKIVIIGGGIGGLCAAACFRARGVEGVVYARAVELREVGAAISIWPNATRVLKHLGLLEALRERSHIPPAAALRDWRGRTLVPFEAFETDVPSLFTHRADVHAVLMSGLEAGMVQLGKACVGIEREGPKVRARFADGTASEWAEGLIGADGIRSVVRAETLKDGLPVYRGYLAWRGVAPFETEELVGETWGRGKRFGFIPLGPGRVGWWATANYSEAGCEAVMRQSRGEWKKTVLEKFADAHVPIGAVVAATPEEAFLCNPIADRVPRERPWGEGAVTLLGDAAHPTTPNLGQGGCMAIEDAAVVARAVAEKGSVAEAFRAYERARFARTAKIVRDSLKMGAAGQWENGVACAVRNWAAKVMPSRGMKQMIVDLWGYDAWNVGV